MSSREPADRLIPAVKRGDSDAAGELVRFYWGDAYRVAYLITHDHEAAEEVAQDALLSAVRSIESFDASGSFRPWLQRITANASYDWHRRRSSRPVLVEEDANISDEAEASLADEIATSALSEELLAALSSLDLDQRAAVVMRHALGYEPQEIAEIVGAPAATVRTRIHRGLARMRAELVKQEGANRA